MNIKVLYWMKNRPRPFSWYPTKLKCTFYNIYFTSFLVKYKINGTIWPHIDMQARLSSMYILLLSILRLDWYTPWKKVPSLFWSKVTEQLYGQEHLIFIAKVTYRSIVVEISFSWLECITIVSWNVCKTILIVLINCFDGKQH